MSFSPEMLTQLQQLIAADTELQGRLQGADEVGQAVSMVVARAGEKGLVVDAAAFKAHLEEIVSAQSAAALSDTQLEGVAGGMNQHEFNTMSVFTVVVGCLIYSAVHPGGFFSCKAG